MGYLWLIYCLYIEYRAGRRHTGAFQKDSSRIVNKAQKQAVLTFNISFLNH